MKKGRSLYVAGAVLVSLTFLFGCVAMGSQTKSVAPVVTVTPDTGKVKANIVIAGSGFQPGEEIDIVMVLGQGMKIGLGTQKVEIIKADAKGAFSAKSKIYRAAKPGTYPIEVSGSMGSEASASLTVVK